MQLKSGGESSVVTIIDGVWSMELYQLLIFTVLSQLLSSLLSFLQGFSLIGVTQKLTYKMRCDLADKINLYHYHSLININKVMSYQESLMMLIQSTKH